MHMGIEKYGWDDTDEDESIDKLPEACIVNALAFATPRDACRVSTLSSTFKTAAESDALWEKFLPANYKSMVEESSDPSLMRRCPTKKDLYLQLSDHPLLVDGGLKSFSLEKDSGKVKYMLSAKDLTIVWADTPSYWTWVHESQSTFSEVAELIAVCWLEIRGKIKTSMLSKYTLYSAFLVFRFTNRSYGFEDCPVEVRLGIGGSEPSKKWVNLYTDKHRTRRIRLMRRPSFLLRPRRVEYHVPMLPRTKDSEVETSCCMKDRGDGWLEVELGDFLNCGGSDTEELEMSLLEVERGSWKGGLTVLGIEIRPKLIN